MFIAFFKQSNSYTHPTSLQKEKASEIPHLVQEAMCWQGINRNSQNEIQKYLAKVDLYEFFSSVKSRSIEDKIEAATGWGVDRPASKEAFVIIIDKKSISFAYEIVFVVTQ